MKFPFRSTSSSLSYACAEYRYTMHNQGQGEKASLVFQMTRQRYMDFINKHWPNKGRPNLTDVKVFYSGYGWFRFECFSDEAEIGLRRFVKLMNQFFGARRMKELPKVNLGTKYDLKVSPGRKTIEAMVPHAGWQSDTAEAKTSLLDAVTRAQIYTRSTVLGQQAKPVIRVEEPAAQDKLACLLEMFKPANQSRH